MAAMGQPEDYQARRLRNAALAAFGPLLCDHGLQVEREPDWPGWRGATAVDVRALLPELGGIHRSHALPPVANRRAVSSAWWTPYG